MRLITLNAWQGRLIRNLVPYFEQQTADIICLQEISSVAEPVPVMDMFRVSEEIQKASGLENLYFSPVHSYEVVGREVAFGNGILTRQPTTNQQTIFTNGTFSKITKTEYVSNTRNAQIVELPTSKGTLTIVNHHAHWELDSRGSEKSLQRLAKLAEALKDIKGPLIVAGDFNLRDDSKAIQFFKEALDVKSLTEQAGVTSTLSSLVSPWEVPCDHIFVNNQIEVKNFQVEETLLSDHKALILDFVV